MLPKGDKEFIRKKLMPKLGIKSLRIRWSDYSRTKYPDIWCEPWERPPRIVVTAEWRRQNMHERRKRLVHEGLHMKGFKHGKHDGLVYSTHPAQDTYSMKVYKGIIRNA